MTWATKRLDQLKAGATDLPPVVKTLRLGSIDDWGSGWVRKRWTSSPEILNVDGSMFGGYIAALADQMQALAALTVLPDECSLRTGHIHVQFFKLTRGEPLLIEASVTSQSNRLIATEVSFFTEDRDLVAKASAQQVVTRK